MFGFRDKAIFAQNQRATAVVTDVKKCWWFKVNGQSARVSGTDGALFPHIIRFSYQVGGVEYRGKRFLNHSLPAPAVGKKLEIYYDKQKPFRCAVKL